MIHSSFYHPPPPKLFKNTLKLSVVGQVDSDYSISLLLGRCFSIKMELARVTEHSVLARDRWQTSYHPGQFLGTTFKELYTTTHCFTPVLHANLSGSLMSTNTTDQACELHFWRQMSHITDGYSITSCFTFNNDG